MSGRPSGIAPLYGPSTDAPAPVHPGETRLCGSCATLIRYWPAESAWRHAILGANHPPELAGSWVPRGRCGEPGCELHGILDRTLGGGA